MFCRDCGAALADQSRFCESCGTPTPAERVVVRDGTLRTSPDQAQKARKPSRISPKAVIIGALIVLGLILLRSLSNHEGSTPATTDQNEIAKNGESPATEEITRGDSFIPPAQKSFASMIDSFIPMYEGADTEIRKTDVRFQRKEAIASYFSGAGSLQFRGWIGKVKELTTEKDGEAYVSIKLHGSNTVIETHNNSFSDRLSQANTMIRRDDALYQSLRDIKQGDDVTISGSFLRENSGYDYVEECSATEQGSMTEPEFIVRFSRISKGVQSLDNLDVAPPVAPAATQASSPPTGVNRVTPPVPDIHADQSRATTCEIANAKGSTCVLESHSRTTDALVGEDWTITITNPSFEPTVYNARIELQNDAGMIVAAASWEGLSVGGYGRHVFSGRLQHDNNLVFTQVNAKLEANRK